MILKYYFCKMVYYDLRGFNDQNLEQYFNVEKFEANKKLGLGQICSKDTQCESGLCTNYYGSGWNINKNGKIEQESSDTQRCAQLCDTNQILSNCYGDDDKYRCNKLNPISENTQFKCVGKKVCSNAGVPTCWDNVCINCKCDDSSLNGPIGESICKPNHPKPNIIMPPKKNTNPQNNIIKPPNQETDNLNMDVIKSPVNIKLNIGYNNKNGKDVKNTNRKIVKGNSSEKMANILPQKHIFDRMTEMASFMNK